MNSETFSAEDLEKMMARFLDNREQLIRCIEESADQLNKHHTNVNVTKVVTGSTGIAGTLISLAGLAMAIPTGGVSLVLTLGGGLLAATSATAHVGSDIVERILTKSHLNDLNQLCHADEANVLKLGDYLREANERLQKNPSGGDTFRRTASSMASEVLNASSFAFSVVRVANAASLTVRSVRIIGNVSAVLNIATLPLQVIDLAANGQALHNRESSETSVKLRQLAEQLRIQMGNIRQFMQHLERNNQ